MPYPHSRPEGRVHRDRLRRLIVPRLYVGARVPSGIFLGRILGIDPSNACRHMRMVLAEAGVEVEQRRERSIWRLYVTAMRRAAA